MQLAAIIEREGEGCVSLCPELDIFVEAVELWLECASEEERKRKAIIRQSGLPRKLFETD